VNNKIWQGAGALPKGKLMLIELGIGNTNENMDAKI
jgi:hypothetical protein